MSASRRRGAPDFLVPRGWDEWEHRQGIAETSRRNEAFAQDHGGLVIAEIVWAMRAHPRLGTAMEEMFDFVRITDGPSDQQAASGVHDSRRIHEHLHAVFAADQGEAVHRRSECVPPDLAKKHGQR